MSSKSGFSRHEQLTAASLLKYKLGYSHARIAKLFNVSVMTISRMLDAAISEGIVTISVKTSIDTDDELARLVKEKYALQDALIVKNSQYEDEFTTVTQAAAAYLDMIIFPGDILGVAAGRTLSRVMQRMELPSIDRKKDDFEIVQLLGGYPKLGERNPANTIVTFVGRMGNKGRLLQHPMYAPSKEAASMIYEHYMGEFERAWKGCTILLAGVGVRGPHCFQREEKLLSNKDLDELDRLEAVGDIFGRWFDLNGDYLDCGPNHKVISILPEIQKNIPRRILLSFGAEKLVAIDILLKKSIANIFISDEMTAKELLKR